MQQGAMRSSMKTKPLSKEIYLIRHAKVDIKNTESIYASEVQNWVESYDTAPLEPTSLPDESLYVLIKKVDFIMSSKLKRSIDSLKMLGVKAFESHDFFNEARIPKASIPLIKLKPRSWLRVLRIIQMLGMGKNDNALVLSKRDAEKAAGYLIELTKAYERIAVVGHGGMNWLISKELQKQGWTVEGKPMHQNWGVTKLVSHR